MIVIPSEKHIHVPHNVHGTNDQHGQNKRTGSKATSHRSIAIRKSKIILSRFVVPLYIGCGKCDRKFFCNTRLYHHASIMYTSMTPEKETSENTARYSNTVGMHNHGDTSTKHRMTPAHPKHNKYCKKKTGHISHRWSLISMSAASRLSCISRCFDERKVCTKTPSAVIH